MLTEAEWLVEATIIFRESYRIAPNGCWIWTGTRDDKGYARLAFGGRRAYGHRLAWRLFRGIIPKGREVCHDCPGGDKPACVNPSHLWLGTHAENVADYRRKSGTGGYLTEADVAWARRMYATSDMTQSELAAALAVSQNAITAAIRRKTWKGTAGDTGQVFERARAGRTIKRSIPRGDAKFTPAEICAVRLAYRLGTCSQRQLASEYGVAWQVIQKIVTGKTYRWVQDDAEDENGRDAHPGLYPDRFQPRHAASPPCGTGSPRGRFPSPRRVLPAV